MLKILENNFILAIVTYVSLFVTLSSLRNSSKRLMYCAYKKNNSYVILFWNASKKVIEKHDIYYFYLLANDASKVNCRSLYSTDYDVEPIISSFVVTNPKSRYKEKKFKGFFKKVDIKFDFLMPHQGMLFEMEEVTNSLPYQKDMIMYGRLYKEKVESVNQLYEKEHRDDILGKSSYYTNLFYDQVISRTPLVFAYVGMFSWTKRIFVQYGNVLNILNEADGKCWLLALIILMLSTIWQGNVCYFTHMPPKLKKKLRWYKKQGYRYVNIER